MRCRKRKSSRRRLEVQVELLPNQLCSSCATSWEPRTKTPSMPQYLEILNDKLISAPDNANHHPSAYRERDLGYMFDSQILLCDICKTRAMRRTCHSSGPLIPSYLCAECVCLLYHVQDLPGCAGEILDQSLSGGLGHCPSTLSNC